MTDYRWLRPDWRSDRLPLAESRWEAARVPRRYRSVLPTSSLERLAHQEVIRGYLRSLPTNDRNGLGLLMYGPRGSGKSHLAATVLGYVLRAGAFVRPTWIAAADLHGAKREEVDDLGCTRYAWVREAPWVVIDDLGEEGSSEWLQTTLSIIKRRYEDQLPTIITTNLDLEELVERYPWLASIMLDGFRVVEVAGVDWRAR